VRWLAIDPGEARVGLAVCDPDERVAVPLEVVPASAAFPAIRAIVAREEIGGIVIGLPLLPSGDEGDAAQMARRLGARIARSIEIEIVYEDERLTSVAAEERSRSAGGRGGPSDDLAAAILLEQFLEQRRPDRPANAGGGARDATA
jgi:putative Holliday junction resolvase